MSILCMLLLISTISKNIRGNLFEEKFFNAAQGEKVQNFLNMQLSSAVIKIVFLINLNILPIPRISKCTSKGFISTTEQKKLGYK